MTETMLHVDEFLRKRKVKKIESESFVAVEKQREMEGSYYVSLAIERANARGFPSELKDYLKNKNKSN